MMPPLKAQESIAQIDELSYAQGALTREDAQKYINGLRQVASRQKEREAMPRPKSTEDMLKLFGGTSTEVTLIEGPETKSQR